MHHELDPLEPQSEAIELVKGSFPQARFHHTVQAVFVEKGQRHVITYGGLHENRQGAARFKESLEKKSGFKDHCQVIELQRGVSYRPWSVGLDLTHGKDDGQHGSTLNKKTDKHAPNLLAPQSDPQKWPGGGIKFW